MHFHFTVSGTVGPCLTEQQVKFQIPLIEVLLTKYLQYMLFLQYWETCRFLFMAQIMDGKHGKNIPLNLKMFNVFLRDEGI